MNYTWDVRDWVVDYLRPTADLGGNATRKAPFDIDNAHKKSALLVNNMYPGPLVEAYDDELICITVTNNMLSEALSIHWHGLHMVGSPAMDGVYGVTQAGIPAQGGSMVYRFVGNAGTHFWHAHMQANQADQGLKGPIVIRPRAGDPHAGLYTEERLLVLSDEWRDPAACLRAEGAQPGNPVCAEIDKASWNGAWGDGSAEYPWPLVTVAAGTCYRLRLVAMMGQAQNFLLSLAGHTTTLIAVDGADVEALNVTQLNLHAGERADVVVCADQPAGSYLVSAQYARSLAMTSTFSSSTNSPAPPLLVSKSLLYLLQRTRYDLACFLETAPAPSMPKVDSCNFWSFLHYEGTPLPQGRARHKLLGGYEPPPGEGGGLAPRHVSGVTWNTNLQADWTKVTNLPRPEPEPEQADVTYTLNVGLAGPEYAPGRSAYGTTEQLYMYTNATPWRKPRTPYLHTKGTCGAEGVPVITVPDGAKSVELIINNLSPTAHVLHMHGMRFSVVNYAPYSSSWCSAKRFDCFLLPFKAAKLLDCHNAVQGDPNGKGGENATYWGCPYDAERDSGSQMLDAPLQKDMISLWRRSWVVLRFKVENPGTWLFHCHMEQHIPTGQVMAFNLLPALQPPIPDGVPTEGPCPVWSRKN